MCCARNCATKTLKVQLIRVKKCNKNQQIVENTNILVFTKKSENFAQVQINFPLTHVHVSVTFRNSGRDQFWFLLILLIKSEDSYHAQKTGNTQPTKQVHRSPRWYMKDNGKGYLFCKWVFLIKGLFLALKGVEAGGKLPFFK